jgi:hypothetical protein
MNRVLGSVLFVASTLTLANAQIIPPAKLQVSPDGASTTVEYVLANVIGTSASVHDQSSNRLFELCGKQVGEMTIFAQAAGLAAGHKIGFYTSDPNAITWVIGGSGTGLGSSNAFSVMGKFGLAMDNGAGSIFWSESALNGGNNHVAVIVDPKDSCNLFLAWEDLKGLGDQDYNDLVMSMENVQAVPEPATMAVLGIGALGLLRRRNKKA